MYPLTDFPERLGRLREVVLRGEGGDKAATIEWARPHGRLYLVKLEGRDSAEAVVELRGDYITIAREEAVSLPPGEYYHYQIVGLRVEEEGGRGLGTIREVLATGANDVYVVERRGEGDLLIPAIKLVVRDIDLEAGVMVVRPLKEWLE